jgi:hypothetical protein
VFGVGENDTRHVFAFFANGYTESVNNAGGATVTRVTLERVEALDARAANSRPS